MRQTSKVDRATLWKKIGYAPHSEAQQAFHDSDARFRIPVCGRRFGKSTMAAVDLVEASFTPNAVFWICGPTYKLAEREFRVVRKAFTDKDKLNLAKEIRVVYNVQQGDMRIHLPWDTIIECVSATNPDSLLGEGLHGVIMSEAARHKMETWQQYVEPALSDNLGWATFPTTPRGYNWIQGLWSLGQHPDHPDYDSWRYPSWLNTAKYPHDTWPDKEGVRNEELQRIKSTVSPSYWAQEYAAEFTTFQGRIYDEFDEKLHVKKIVYNPAWKNYCVFDYGFNDPFVCLDIMVDPEDNVYVWREYQESWKTTWEHAHVIRDRPNPEGFHIDAMFGDPRGPDQAATIGLVLGYVYSEPVDWQVGIESVKRHLKLQPNGIPKLFIDHSCQKLIAQMNKLRHLEAKNEKNPKEGQVDWDDHGPDALRYFFQHKFVLGLGESLSDLYDAPLRSTEAETFFKLTTGVKLDSEIGYFG